MGDATVVLTPDGSIQHAIVGAAFRWGLLRGPDPDRVPLEGNFLTRAGWAELLVGAEQWAALGGYPFGEPLNRILSPGFWKNRRQDAI